MDKEKTLELIKNTQLAVEQMKQDDIEDNPDAAYETFNCECCGQDKIRAGSMIYNAYLLCNDCVLLAEIAFALHKAETIEDFMVSMENKRLESLCDFIKHEQNTENN